MVNEVYFCIDQDLEIKNPLRVFFLCGSSFKDEESDKRIVLRDTLEKSFKKNYKALILEDHFIFNSRDSRKINYNLIGLKSLKDIEIMTSFLSDMIIILHESISTAAEIGLFSHRKDMLEKMLLLIPDELSAEESFLSGFLRLAYDNKFFENYNIRYLTYYPEFLSFHQSNNIQKFHSRFNENQVGERLLKKMEKTLPSETLIIKKIKRKRGYYTIRENCYTEQDGKFTVFLDSNTLKALFISLFSLVDVRNKLREKMNIRYNSKSMHDKVKVVNHFVNNLKKIFQSTMEATLTKITGIEVSSMKIKIINSDSDFNTSFIFLFYLFDAFKLVSVVSENLSPHITITSELATLSNEYKVLINRDEGGVTLDEVIANE